MSTARLILKNPRGWFAAGAEVEKAMTVLSDGALRLFVYLCLNARRDTGVLETSLTQLSRDVKRRQQTVRSHLREMATAGICHFQFHRSHLTLGYVEITETYWPYQKTAEETQANGSEAFISEVKKMLQDRACVRAFHSAADEILAREWFDQGINLECIEQAFLLGCMRKYVSWRNNQTRSLIGSLRYFQAILDELKDLKTDKEYWNYIRYRLGRMENQWKQNYQKSVSQKNDEEQHL
jgi:predicted transcriptional regulator